MKQYENECAEIENSLPLFVGGDLEEPAASTVARHLTQCSVCTEREQAARSARDLMVSALALSERRTPALWPGVRAALVRESVLSEPTASVRPSAPRRLRLLPYAAAAAALLAGVWLVRDAFDGEANGPRPDELPIVNVPTPTPRPVPIVTPDVPVVPVAMTDRLRPLKPGERALSEGAEIYSDLPLDRGLGTGTERWITTPVLRRP